MYKKFVQILSYTVSFPTWGKKTRTRTCLCVYVCVCVRARLPLCWASLLH